MAEQETITVSEYIAEQERLEQVHLPDHSFGSLKPFSFCSLHSQ